MIHLPEQVQKLIQNGAVIHSPYSVDIDSSVDLTRISPDITIHAGCRIKGKTTSIGPGTVIGEEGPVTIADCQLAANVTLKGGSFTRAVMMANMSFGSCAHVREGTLLEEQVSCAHSVGLKQTILMPYVTLGSLINFCDCLMAGGTDRKNHSEVGSSYIHFNYTPNQDKATASLIGDVPRGVMINQRPIFLGGQGGLVGPSRIEYGTVIAAGTICRKDNLEANMLLFGTGPRNSGALHYDSTIYGNISRTLSNNFIYIGNLHALYHWYKHFRRLYLMKDSFDRACYEGAITVLQSILQERIKHLGKLADNMDRSITAAKHKFANKLPDQPYALQKKFAKQWPRLSSRLEYDANAGLATTMRKNFMKAIDKNSKASYLDTIKHLPAETKTAGTLWLQSVVDSISALCIS
ncbi:MAG: hypothetical protein A2283_01085 [Lentisphaerae bacterium RIFOXYA12_FULL_48_11]|nr:MAG: hypothetical protein A2283_01085 [Lentisphaerae bacterium RIFOXYA12_FULL_48_11]